MSEFTAICFVVLSVVAATVYIGVAVLRGLARCKLVLDSVIWYMRPLLMQLQPSRTDTKVR